MRGPTGELVWWQVVPFHGRLEDLWTWQVWCGELLIGRGHTTRKWTGLLACWRCCAVFLWRHGWPITR